MFMDSLQYKALSLCLKKRLLVFLFSSLVFLLRMRSVGKSRFQLSELVAGEPRPKARRVLIETPFRLEPLPCITDTPAQLPAPHARTGWRRYGCHSKPGFIARANRRGPGGSSTASRPRGSVGMVASYDLLTDCWRRVRIPHGPRVRLRTDRRPG